MIDTLIGNVGHLFVIVSFVSALLAAFGYYKYTVGNPVEQLSWKRFSRSSFYVHSFSVMGIVATLFAIIYLHKFEYHYAWSHSSLVLPAYYMISSFWEGQEGSFLLWMFWHVVIGLFLMHTNKQWEGPTMTVFALIQAFLVSMILGVVIGDVKIGSTPFILLRDAVSDPIFSIDPNFKPEDGTGLNPLLQNYWMVIHPPTLFLGFGLALVPFSYVIAGLWTGRYKDWVRPALPWAHATAFVLGLGIMMGAVWAYETLNFGGYWNWDPVENAVYIPWLILVGGIHTMITFRKSNTALKASILLIIASFILILYSTFLTRSGILGNASVHSFTDLGLSGQLLVYLLFFLAIALFFTFRAWKHLPSTDEEVSTYSREFWIFIGSVTLTLMAFQVLIPTSIPVWNAIVEAFGGISNMAPPADQVGFYSKFQLWFAVAVAILSGTGQFFWWKKMKPGDLWKAISVPLIITLLISSVLIVWVGMYQIAYILLLTAGIYSIVANGKIFADLARKNIKLSGGAVAHIGVAMMFLGILASAGYSKILSVNTTGRLINRELPDDINLNNIPLFYGKPEQMGEYTLTYSGKFVEPRYISNLVNERDIEFTSIADKVVAKNDILHKGKVQAVAGDTLEIRPENTYFRVTFEDAEGKTFDLFPRAQINENMGGLLASPDIKHFAGRDIYAHASSIPNPDVEIEWNGPQQEGLQIGQQFFVNDYVAKLVNVERLSSLPGVEMGAEDVAVRAVVEVQTLNEVFTMRPVFIIKDGMVGRLPDENTSIGVKLVFNNIVPEENRFDFEVYTAQQDWLVFKVIEFPWVNWLWIGTILVLIGFGMAIFRRYREYALMDQKSAPKKKKHVTEAA